MEPPVWLNTEFLSAAIDEGKGNVDILEFEAKPAVPEGNNYLGCLFRIKLKFKNRCSEEIQSTSLIVKTPLINGIIKDFADKLNTVAREVEIYNTVLPKINRYLGDETLTPKKFFSLRDDVLVLEDLNREGYIMCDRIKQLDRDHCLCFMRVLAKFHASSVALHEMNPDLIEKVGKEILFAEGTGWLEDQSNYINQCFTSAANALKTVKSYEQFGEKILKQIDTMWDRLVRLFSKEKHIKVLNHGDMWTNNILFKHDDLGRVVDVKIVDFQICRYATPAIDIQYFLMSSTNADVRNNGFSELIDEYRETLNATLRKLNCKIQLSAEELEEEIRFAEPFGFFILCALLPIVMADPENPPKASDNKEALESSYPNVNTFLQIYYDSRFIDLLVEHLQRLEETGFFISML